MHATAKALAQSFHSVVQSSSDAIVMEDSEGRITFWSTGAQHMFGYSATDMQGQSRHRLIPVELAQQDAQLLAQLGKTGLSISTTRLDKSGHPIAVMATYSALLGSRGQRTGLCCVMRDTQRQKVADELIRSMSFNDALTGLPNWRLLRDRLWRAQLNSGRQRSYFAVLYVDLDGFKMVNDQHGHDAGDQLLMEVAARLMAAIRQNDTVGRLGGDEFVVLLEDLGASEAHARNHANAVADKILDLLEGRDFILGQAKVQCTASIGIQVVHGGNGHVDQVIKQADAAMARVKEGRRRVVRGDFVGKPSD